MFQQIKHYNKILTHIKSWPSKSYEQISVCSNIYWHIHTLSKYTPATLQTIYSKKILITISSVSSYYTFLTESYITP